MELGDRSKAAIAEIAAALDAGDAAATVRREHPRASRAACLAAALLRQHPCRGTGEGRRFEPLFEKWSTIAHALPPDSLLDAFLHLGDAGWAAHERALARASLPALSPSERFALYWLWGACGIGAFRFDHVLMTLACMLGYGSVVLAASSNDNGDAASGSIGPSPPPHTVTARARHPPDRCIAAGLLHQELVDFELPPSLGWAAPLPRGASHRTARACAETFSWVQTDRASGVAAEERRRRSRSRALRATVTRAAAAGVLRAASSAPCELRFGGRAAHAEGGVAACAYIFPEGQQTAAGAHKDCYAWCVGTLSAAHARVSLVHSRLPRVRVAQANASDHGT